MTGRSGKEGGNAAVQDLWLWRLLALGFGLVDLGWNGQALQETTGNSSSLVVHLPAAREEVLLALALMMRSHPLHCQPTPIETQEWELRRPKCSEGALG